ncbi:hypothetical protein BGX23_009332 [Mortierella sp. AD031]|nr:hypothetical protein BGX23_009332 [Mortierella sp. AD031]KAG0218195.1 hypothetical protein BGX33_008213 [Mortierella sp. NVP41]
MARSPAKSKSTAVVVDESKDAVSKSSTTTTTTTTTVTVVDETVASLSVVAATATEETTVETITPAATQEEDDSQEESKRELPIFNNPLLADDKTSAVTLKPKSGRVKVQGGKTATVAVLKMSAPKVDGEVVVMRRMDSDMVNATLMFQAAFPAATEQWISKENTYLAKTYEPHGAVVEGEDNGALVGVWVTISQAKELAKEYSIDQFMLPLLNAPARKSTIKASSPPASSSSSTPEIVTKEEQTVVEETTAAVVVVEKVAITSEETVVVEEKTEVTTEEKTVETVEEKKVEEAEEKNEQEQDQEQEESTGSKRGREESEEQAARDRKRFRGFVTVAVGLAAVAATLPQVLPYFS